MKKIFKVLEVINVWFMVLGALLTIYNSAFGTFVFLYSCIIGFVSSIKHRNKEGIIINSAFGIMNVYFSVLTTISFLKWGEYMNIYLIWYDKEVMRAYKDINQAIDYVLEDFFLWEKYRRHTYTEEEKEEVSKVARDLLTIGETWREYYIETIELY